MNLVGAELIARRALQIQRVVRRSPRRPNFEGLESMLSSAIDETGGIVTSKFDEFVANEQKVAANILKQQRLWHDEADTDKRDQPADEQPGAGRGAPRRPKNGHK